jgi:glutamyl-Q tRNA(Asp) synthetase
MPAAANGYRGRFAPSPTGPLHFGSLVAAMASYLDARACGGQWLLRMEDVDEGRVVPGAADDILRTLETFGFRWDGELLVQSDRKDAYQEAIATLKQHGHAYDCGCTRREVAAAAQRHGPEGPIYPGTCRHGLPPGKRPRSVRLKVPDRSIRFVDRIAGPIHHNLARELGDFVIHRADGYTAYQLAVVLDDAAQGINQVVRGADLLLSTPRQIYLQELLGLATPEYAHIPLVRGEDGHKLSKQDSAHPVRTADPLPALLSGLLFLGQSLPEGRPASVEAFWQHAIPRWDIERVARPAET